MSRKVMKKVTSPGLRRKRRERKKNGFFSLWIQLAKLGKKVKGVPSAVVDASSPARQNRSRRLCKKVRQRDGQIGGTCGGKAMA